MPDKKTNTKPAAKKAAPKKTTTTKSAPKKTSKVSENIKDLKNISSFGGKKLALWGMIGAAVLLIFTIVATIMLNIDSDALETIFRVVGLGLGLAYALIGIFGIIHAINNQKGSYWGLLLAASIIALLGPLAWFSSGGIAIAVIAGIVFTLYYLLED